MAVTKYKQSKTQNEIVFSFKGCLFYSTYWWLVETEEWSSALKGFCFDKESLAGLQKSPHLTWKLETLSTSQTWKCGEAAACGGVVLVNVGCRCTSWRLFCAALWPFLCCCVKFGGISAALCGVMPCFMSFGGSLQRCQWAPSPCSGWRSSPSSLARTAHWHQLIKYLWLLLFRLYLLLLLIILETIWRGVL